MAYRFTDYFLLQSTLSLPLLHQGPVRDLIFATYPGTKVITRSIIAQKLQGVRRFVERRAKLGFHVGIV